MCVCVSHTLLYKWEQLFFHVPVLLLVKPAEKGADTKDQVSSDSKKEDGEHQSHYCKNIAREM